MAIEGNSSFSKSEKTKSAMHNLTIESSKFLSTQKLYARFKKCYCFVQWNNLGVLEVKTEKRNRQYLGLSHSNAVSFQR